MKTKVLFIALTFCVAFVSCKKDEKEKDFRDGYVGTYAGKCTWTNNGTMYESDLSVDITKSSVSKQKMVFKAEFYFQKEVVDIDVSNDGSFSGTFATRLGNPPTSTTVIITGGRFSGNSLRYSYSAQGWVTISVNLEKK